MRLNRTSGDVVELWADVTKHDGFHLVTIKVLLEGIHDMYLLPDVVEELQGQNNTRRFRTAVNCLFL